jgi:hypothetical protein
MGIKFSGCLSAVDRRPRVVHNMEKAPCAANWVLKKRMNLQIFDIVTPSAH